MRLQRKSGRQSRFRLELQEPICMPPPSGSLSAGSRAACMTNSLASKEPGIPRILGNCEATIARSRSLGNAKTRFVRMVEDRADQLTARAGKSADLPASKRTSPVVIGRIRPLRSFAGAGGARGPTISCRAISSSVIGHPSGSAATPAQAPIERWKRVLGSRNRKSCAAAATSRFQRCTPHSTISISATSEWRTMSASANRTTAISAIGSSRRAIWASPESPSRRSL